MKPIFLYAANGDGGHFIDWSLYYLMGADYFKSYAGDEIKLTHDPVNDEGKNSHNHNANFIMKPKHIRFVRQNGLIGFYHYVLPPNPQFKVDDFFSNISNDDRIIIIPDNKWYNGYTNPNTYLLTIDELIMSFDTIIRDIFDYYGLTIDESRWEHWLAQYKLWVPIFVNRQINMGERSSMSIC
jgi:hypothetical protein